MTDVAVDKHAGVATLWMGNAPVNAQTIAGMHEIVGALAALGEDASVRAIVLASRFPRAFCAGLDLVELQTLHAEQLRRLVELIYLDLWRVQANLGKPTIAAVAGAARGGGITMAMSCDMIVADTTASFAYPEIDAGLIPGIHFSHLPRLVGRYKAFELLFAPQSFDADAAKSYGLVNRVVPEGQAIAAAQELAHVLAAKPPEALIRSHQEFKRATNLNMERDHRHAVDIVCEQLATAESKALIRSFAERRTVRKLS